MGIAYLRMREAILEVVAILGNVSVKLFFTKGFVKVPFLLL